MDELVDARCFKINWQDCISHITSDILTKCLEKLPKGDGAQSIEDLVRLIHFQVQENNNVKSVEEDKSGLVLRYFDDDQKKWYTEDKDKILRQMVHRPRQMLNDHFCSNMPDFERDFTKALFDFVQRWFVRTRNTRSPSYKRLMDIVSSLIQNVEQRLESEQQVYDDDQDSDDTEHI